MKTSQQSQLPFEPNVSDSPDTPVTRRGRIARSPDASRVRNVGVAATGGDARQPEAPSAVPSRVPLLLTVRDLEAELQLGRTRTYELLRSGEISVIRVGRALRVSRDALRRWIDEQTG